MSSCRGLPCVLGRLVAPGNNNDYLIRNLLPWPILCSVLLELCYHTTPLQKQNTSIPETQKLIIRDVNRHCDEGQEWAPSEPRLSTSVQFLLSQYESWTNTISNTIWVLIMRSFHFKYYYGMVWYGMRIFLFSRLVGFYAIQGVFVNKKKLDGRLTCQHQKHKRQRTTWLVFLSS